MTAVITCATFLLASNDGWAQHLTGKDRTDHIEKIVSGCIERSKASPSRVDLSPQLINEYCRCYAERIVDLATIVEIDSKDPEVMRRIATEAAKPCIDSTLKALKNSN
jgi:hypothetical protein